MYRLALFLLLVGCGSDASVGSYHVRNLGVPPNAGGRSVVFVDEVGMPLMITPIDNSQTIQRYLADADQWHTLDLGATPPNFTSLGFNGVDGKLYINAVDGTYYIPPTGDGIGAKVFPAPLPDAANNLPVIPFMIDAEGRWYGETQRQGGRPPTVYRTEPGSQIFGSTPVLESTHSEIGVSVAPDGTLYLGATTIEGYVTIERFAHDGSQSTFYMGCAASTCPEPSTLLQWIGNNSDIAYASSLDNLDQPLKGGIWKYDQHGTPTHVVNTTDIPETWTTHGFYTRSDGTMLLTAGDQPSPETTYLYARSVDDADDTSTWQKITALPTLSSLLGRNPKRMFFTANYFGEISMVELVKD